MLKKKTTGKELEPRIPKDKILDLYFQHHHSCSSIGRQLGCSRQYVQKVIKPFKDLIEKPEILEFYRKRRPDMLTAAEMKLIENIVDKDKLKAASLNNTAYALQQVFNARRLEEGLGTENVNLNIVAILDRAIKDGKRQRKQQRLMSLTEAMAIPSALCPFSFSVND